MQKTPTIKVECYAGHKADEKPISFTFGEKKLMIEEIIDQWRGLGVEYFKVLADDGEAYLLRHDGKNGGLDFGKDIRRLAIQRKFPPAPLSKKNDYPTLTG